MPMAFSSVMNLCVSVGVEYENLFIIALALINVLYLHQKVEIKTWNMYISANCSGFTVHLCAICFTKTARRQFSLSDLQPRNPAWMIKFEFHLISFLTKAAFGQIHQVIQLWISALPKGIIRPICPEIREDWDVNISGNQMNKLYNDGPCYTAQLSK